MFEPIFPWYVTHIRMAGGTVVPVRLDPPGFALDPERLRAAFSPRTKMVIFNTPHNPTGAGERWRTDGLLVPRSCVHSGLSCRLHGARAETHPRCAVPPCTLRGQATS